MLRILKQALLRGPATNAYPVVVAEPPDGFRGKPVIDFARCSACDLCAQACPTTALTVRTSGDNVHDRVVELNYGDCVFCGECEAACPTSIHLTKEFQLATTGKSTLITQARYTTGSDGAYQFAGMVAVTPSRTESLEEIGTALKKKIRTIFKRSLHIRAVDAGSCNGCEIEITALNNPVYDVERFGVHFVASPRHADVLLVTGPVTRNMEIALRQTYDATPDPKLVIAVGACGIGGGIFGTSYASRGGVDAVVPVDVFIPGCPPRPEALLQGILMAMEKYSRGRQKS